MNYKKVSLVLVAGVLLIGLSACGGKTVSNSQDNTGKSSNESAVKQEVPKVDVKLSMVEVATHKSADSCYVVIQGEIYDLTQWIFMHPGGPDKIEPLCGTDGTNAFMGQHGGMPRPHEMLKTFKIGVVKS